MYTYYGTCLNSVVTGFLIMGVSMLVKVRKLMLPESTNCQVSLRAAYCLQTLQKIRVAMKVWPRKPIVLAETESKMENKDFEYW